MRGRDARESRIVLGENGLGICNYGVELIISSASVVRKIQFLELFNVDPREIRYIYRDKKN